MSTPILATKLYIPPPRPEVVLRPRLIECLNEGLDRRLTLISAPAGFGKTTLLSEWVAGLPRQAAWLSLDEGDSDPTRFLAYLVAALRTVAPNIGEGALAALQSPQPPPTEAILTALLNEIAAAPDEFVLVLDDYHVVDSNPVDDALAFLIEHLPPRMHLVVATREDPPLHLARLRVRGQLTELRAADLRFTSSEAAEFLEEVMGLDLSAEDIAALESRTEGWIAGLQLAAISMRGHEDAAGFIESFTGSHHFVLDYLLEEVLGQQSESVQAFLLRTSILDYLCAPLCDAVLLDPSASGRKTLEYIEHANLFIVPLDDERRWYRYHHLFTDLLRQRLQQSAASSTGNGGDIAELHSRASVWFEDNGLEIEAFHHAAAANDVERAARLAEGEGTPLIFRGAAALVLNWLESLPTTEMNAMPSLWVMYATSLFFDGQIAAVEPKLQAAEAALKGAEPDDEARDLIGRVASMRATLAIIPNDVETIIAQSRRALEFLRPDNLPVRTATTYTLGYAYQLQGDRAAAREAYTEILDKSVGDPMYTIAATLSLGQVQEADNELSPATRTYERVVQLAGDPPWPIACEAHIGLARIFYQWNDLDTAVQHGQQCLELTRQMESVDTFASYELFLARLKLAQGDAPGAAAVLDEAEEFVREHDFMFRMPDVAAAQVLALLHRGDPASAARLAETHDLPISQAEKPEFGDDEVLVRVHAAGVDRGVWHIMTGLPYPIRLAGYGLRAPTNPVIGSDVAGLVEAVGKNVTRFQPGDEVFGIGKGTFAEYALALEDKLAPKPANLTFEQAAAVAISGLTALQGLRDHGRIEPGQRVLVIGASGGVGTFAVQIAKSFGAEVTGVCGATKVDMVRSIGADHVIDYTRGDFAEGDQRYDVILDIGGNSTLARLRRALTPKGTLVITGGETDGRWLGGTDRQLRALALSPFVGQKLGTFIASENHEDMLVLKEFIESGKVAPVIDRNYPLAEAPEAIRYLEEGRAKGKVVITIGTQ